MMLDRIVAGEKTPVLRGRLRHPEYVALEVGRILLPGCRQLDGEGRGAHLQVSRQPEVQPQR